MYDQSSSGREETRPSKHATIPTPLHRRKSSLIDELLPLPTSTPTRQSLSLGQIARRTTSVGIIFIFLLCISFLAITTHGSPSQSSHSLKAIFGLGYQDGIVSWIAGDLESEQHKTAKIDFEQYKMILSLKAKDLDITTPGKRLVFIGDIHGSFDPLQRLLSQLKYNSDHDKIIHVGDLVAKGDKNTQVLEWMRLHEITGVRGNHDQPVLEWRAWMEWAGGDAWEDFVDSFQSDDEQDLRADEQDRLEAMRKGFPKHWKWKSQHWKIAREMTKAQYKYLVDLPLALHMPSLHSIVVHAGMLPHDTYKSTEDPSQPLVSAAETSSASGNAGRLKEELALLLNIPQNKDPWTLINLRSIYTKGKKKGKLTKSTKKGTPWSEVWQEEMSRCTGDGAKALLRSKLPNIECSPVTVLYGHAAARGLDIKDFSKGIDTGCVYGHSLTALVLGDTSGLDGEPVTVGDHQGVLISTECKKGGI
ncbi:Metallo-dependent phosphatase-like protein [Kockovaella imperatae]|uniref:Metallo-dependent phosphatase-like protein n=1 Tax=Kockovaella imperatae TaxID=4999 RepID=A0A1Y1UMM3_9TREE|nr:Metallo-dependent phosphatase-like protein [Kockovaella imperatae]ORX39259.1 Metallo-dependent phosphatase-like protein [Kockovaella imperatae]